MKQNRLLILLISLAVMSTAWGESISENQARSIAANFMASRTRTAPIMKMARKAPQLGAASGNKAAYYVFNDTQGGYVIVAGDDRVPAVLAYSDQGAFDTNDVPEAMQCLLESYADQMAALDKGAKAAAHLTGQQPISPLLTCAWSQNNPYNILLPYLSVTGRHAVVGCVATAMAQMMYYWKWPARPTTDIPAYTTEEYNIYMPQLPPVDFNWNTIHDTYGTTDTTTISARNAARVSLYCAQSVKMDFKKGASSAYSEDIIEALSSYFGYRSDMKMLRRQEFTTQQWEALILAELSNKRPVVYRGSKKSSGHAFICDGYDGNGLFHINWGWNGSSNGYFLLNVLNPDAQGTGSAEGAYGYVSGQGMIVGIRPGSQADPVFEITAKYLDVTEFSSTRNSSSESFDVTLQTHFINRTNQPLSFNYGWALYQGNSMLKILNNGSFNDLNSNYYIYPTRTLYLGEGITSGTYRIVPVYCELNSTNWRPCIGSDVNYATVTINGNTCNVTDYGIATTPDYEINDISATGHMHANRPVSIKVNLTNLGTSRNDLLYMFVNGQFHSYGFIDLEHGATGDVEFMYMQETTGTANLTFSLNDDGSSPIGSKTLNITSMPTASLSAWYEVQNVTDPNNYIITSDKFSLVVHLTNNSSAYNEDITVTLYKYIYGNYGTTVQIMNKPLSLGRGSSTTMQFDLDNVMDGWKYFANVSYYSGGNKVSLGSTAFYTIHVPQSSTDVYGDVNGDGEVSVADVNIVVDIILGHMPSADIRQRADVNKDNEISIADINAIINIILKQ